MLDVAPAPPRRPNVIGNGLASVVVARWEWVFGEPPASQPEHGTPAPMVPVPVVVTMPKPLDAGPGGMMA